MPSSPLWCFGVGVVLFSLAPSALTFSRGASHASCWEMIPGHIRTQPQDLKRSHVTLRTSASSYLPGQFITVTVRSSRDFMGFLLQARSAAGAGVGYRSTGVGPVLVGGSWTLTPPSTHTLRCLSEGDSLTHSDKQLKRNLSFVWRAPDAPMGDIRFYITVVQSYFVYWAGIESAVLRDGSRSPWTGSNVTGVDRGNLTRQKEEVTALPAHKASNKPQETRTEVSRPVSEGNHLTNQAVNERRNSSNFLGSIQTAAKGSENDTYRTSGSVSGVTEEAGTETGSPEDPRSSLQSTNTVPPMASIPPAEAGGVESTTNLSPNITGTLFLPYSLASLPPFKDGEIERNLEDPKSHTIPKTKDTTFYSETTTAAIPLTNHNTNRSRPTSLNPRKPIQDQDRSVKFVTQSSSSQPRRTSKSQISLIKDEKGRQSMAQTQNLHLKPSVHSQTSSTKPLFPSQTGTSHTFSQYQTSSPPLIHPLKNPTHQSFLKTHTTPPPSQAYPLALKVLPIKPTSSLPPPENSPSGPRTISRQTSPHQLQTAAPLSSPPPPLSGSTKVLNQTTPTQTQGQASYPQTDLSKSVPPFEALSISPLPWSQPHSQTAAPQTHTFVWKQTQSSLTRQSIEGKEVKDLPSQAKLKTMGPILVFIPSTTYPSPSLSVSTPFSSTHTLLDSSLVHPTTPFHPSEGSALISVQTSFTHSALSSSPPSTPTKIQPKTASSLSGLPSPSPISIPPHLPLVDPSSTSPFASSLTSSTIPLSNSSNPPLAPLISPVPLSTSSLSPFTSSQSITGSTVSSPSFPTISSSSTASSTSSNSSTHSSPSSSISTSTSTSSSSNLSATSSSTSPHPEPSPVPRRSLYNPLTSSTSSPVPSQQLTIGQRLPIQNHIALSNPQPNLNLPTPRTVVLLNSERHPNLDPNFDLNLGHKLKPNHPKTDTKLPPDPPGTPDKGGKYPDVIPRHSAWELGMLLVCSAGLGMALVVGVRYMCRQACGKQTEVTLNNREAEYGRGERGMLHVQECGDLVRVRRIRENSFVLLAEYDVLASPAD